MNKPTSIFDLLYTNQNAQDLLISKGITGIVQSVEIPDLEALEILTKFVNRYPSEIAVQANEFLEPFWSTRHYRRRFYEAIPTEEGKWNVQNVEDTRPPHTVTKVGELVTCTCQDFAKQQELFQEHPALWRMVKAQPMCKHIFAVTQQEGWENLWQMQKSAPQPETV